MNIFIYQLEEKLVKRRAKYWKLLSPLPLVCSLFAIVQGFTGMIKPNTYALLNPGTYLILYVFLFLLALICLGIPLFAKESQFPAISEFSREVKGILRELQIHRDTWESFSEREKAGLLQIREKFNRNILTWSTSSIIGSYGIFLFFFSGRTTDILIFVLLSVLGFWLYRPRNESRWGRVHSS